jgi:hypothetical protein
MNHKHSHSWPPDKILNYLPKKKKSCVKYIIMLTTCVISSVTLGLIAESFKAIRPSVEEIESIVPNINKAIKGLDDLKELNENVDGIMPYLEDIKELKDMLCNSGMFPPCNEDSGN